MPSAGLIKRLISAASNTVIQYALAAAVLQNGVPIAGPIKNTQGNMKRGKRIGSVHAELNAILKVPHFKKMKHGCYGWSVPDFNSRKKKYSVIVIRLGNNKLLNARPCCECLKVMKACKINKVYYSIDNGSIICEKVKDMISIQSSSVIKQFYEMQNGKKVSKTNYYRMLLLENLPKIIKKINFEMFCKYNLENVLPEYAVKYQHQKAFIFDEKNKMVCQIVIEE